MPPIELGPARPVGPVEAWTIRAAGGKTDEPAKTSKQQAAVVRSDALDPGAAPVDTDRVAVIRKAIDQGTYPILPTKISDAIIAAGLLLRKPK